MRCELQLPFSLILSNLHLLLCHMLLVFHIVVVDLIWFVASDKKKQLNELEHGNRWMQLSAIVALLEYERGRQA